MKSKVRQEHGLTVVEIAVALVLLGVVSAALFRTAIQGNRAMTKGITVAAMQERSRSALQTVSDDLRQVGAAIDRDTYVPIEVASQFRITFVKDEDENGIIGPGERFTYFLDKDPNADAVAGTPNPSDYVLRKVVSTAANPNALPVSGAGMIILSGVTQAVSGRTLTTGGSVPSTWNTPVFDYLDGNGASLIGAGADPAGSEFGLTVPDAGLGKPASGGTPPDVRLIEVQLVAAASYRDSNTGTYQTISMTDRIFPRNN